jgi:hypothetical protein
MPVSLTELIRIAQVRASKFSWESEEAGLCFVADNPNRQLYMFNHIEYDTNSLGDEYRRDVEASKTINRPPIISRRKPLPPRLKTAGAATPTCSSATGLTRFTSPRPSGWKTLVNHKFFLLFPASRTNYGCPEGSKE